MVDNKLDNKVDDDGVDSEVSGIGISFLTVTAFCALQKQVFRAQTFLIVCYTFSSTTEDCIHCIMVSSGNTLVSFN
jgi:hypothetical protein